MDKDTLLNELIELFELSDHDLPVISHIIDACECDRESSIRSLREMGYGANLDFPDPVVNEVTGLAEVRDMFGGDEVLTYSVISNALVGNQGNVEATVEMLLNIRNDEDAVDRLRNGTPDEVKRLEASIQRRQNELFLQRQRELSEEIELERQRMKELKGRLSALPEPVVDTPVNPETNSPPVVETPAIAETPVTVETPVIEQVIPIEQNTLEDTAVEFSPMPDVVVDSMMDSIPAVNVREIQARIQDTLISIIQKEKMLHKMEEENSKCTLSVNISDDQIAVTYVLKAVMKETEFDWIGMYTTDRPNKSYLEYIQTGGGRSGTLFFPKPETPGLYHFRFNPNGSYITIATSDTIYIGPEMEMSVSYTDGVTTLNWNVTSDDIITKSDWFGLYRKGANSRNYIEMINAEESPCTFKTPLKQGEYEVRFFPYQCGYISTQKSPSFTVDGDDSLPIELEVNDNRVNSITVTPDINSVSQNKYDWIGLYDIGRSNRSYITYQYIDPLSGTVSFEAPKSSGTYEIRYFSSSSSRYDDLVRSEPFVIQDTDKVDVEISDGFLTVTWDIFSVEQSSYDWIGLYNASETNNKNYLQSVYIDLKSNSTILPLPLPGHYEIRYFASAVGKYKNFKKSNIFSI